MSEQEEHESCPEIQEEKPSEEKQPTENNLSLSKKIIEIERVLPLAGILGFLMVVLGIFVKFARFSVGNSSNWFGADNGSGVSVFVFCILGSAFLVFRVYVVPLVLSLISLFILNIDVLISYDSVAIALNTVNIPDAEFRRVFDIFRDAFTIGNGAFFVLIGLLIVITVCMLAFLGRLLQEKEISESENEPQSSTSVETADLT